MRKAIVLCLSLLFSLPAFSQVEYVARFEIESDYFDPHFEMVRYGENIVAFRTLAKRAFSVDRIFQYVLLDPELNTERGLIELPVQPGYDLIGYDLDGDFLYVLFQRGTGVGGEKYVLKVDLVGLDAFEFSVENLLDIELAEFLVQNERVIFMGSANMRPVVQVYSLVDKSIQTVQGVYGNDTQILQIRKMPEIEAFEVVLSRKGQYRDKEVILNTYDLLGNLLREIRIDQFGDEDQEIIEALVVQEDLYRKSMIGSFGLARRDSYLGMYRTEINEFGEYDTRLYTLEDFPNFFNYLDEKSKLKKDAEVLKQVDRDKIPSIRNVYSIREVRQEPDGLYVFFDHYNIINSRGVNRGWPFSPTSMYRYDRWSRMSYWQDYWDPISVRRFNQGPLQINTEFSYISAHFVKLGEEGRVVWDNSATYDDLLTDIPEPFGEIAIVGDEFYHAYVRNDKIRLAYIKKGEKKFDNLDFELKLVNETERIGDTDMPSLRLVYWYDRYFILTGNQRVRYQKENGQAATREVFFFSKVMVSGDLYQPEETED
ncbi:MAG: transcriptional regulator [Algoriphagus sp.]|uniref:transcriptional regulator n=1 Tax=Algoriphagus sp. TaxID=1872435 RepID=UPI001791A1BC|nr:transcriptional regulator [Algoriphagus sp.]NVJ85871.1 transcriptional regulator [Algoriphagus sp.]